ncbi:hypothetical protein M2316_003090 [Cellulosimicrobium cellulans]|nr:hypothetical protein [Cellulosimicrobium cellulans]
MICTATAAESLYRARRTLYTGAALLTERQQAHLRAPFALEEHVEAEATSGVYQRMIGLQTAAALSSAMSPIA